MTLARVDLPDTLGPIKEWTSPVRTTRSIAFKNGHYRLFGMKPCVIVKTDTQKLFVGRQKPVDSFGPPQGCRQNRRNRDIPSDLQRLPRSSRSSRQCVRATKGGTRPDG
jgi:hypothetical protein